LILQTDEKSSYATLAPEVFGDRVNHMTTPSRLARGTFNPLFPINTTLAMTRDNLGRLRRQSWLVTKKREYLRSHMNMFLVYRNYLRTRFNRDKEGHSPAVKLGLLPRNLTVAEALGWRQDWGPRSIDPLSADGSRVGSALRRSPAAGGWRNPGELALLCQADSRVRRRLACTRAEGAVRDGCCDRSSSTC
jgi:hypothetical protein